MIAKRGTKKLHDAGFIDMVIQKGIYGFYLYIPGVPAQQGIAVQKTIDGCIEQAKAGLRPKVLKK